MIGGQPTDLITKLSTVKYDPDASAPVWCKFLDRTFACRERLIKYIQRLIGYALTGMVNEQILLILWGGGSNGKSTLLSAVLDMLGPDYSMQAVSDLLMSSRNDKHPTERADLFGKRFVSCVETEGNRSLAESLVKQLTGGEKVRARRMREDFWEFDPTHKIVLATNHKPRIKGTDHAIWRRVRLIPFPVKFWDPDKGETGPVELRQDKFLSDKLRAELPGILRWAVEGSRDWQQNGLKAPAEVLAATDEYRDSQDVLTAFIEDRCVTGEQFTTQAGPLYQAYREWAEQNGEELMSNRRFGECLTERGFDGEKKTYVFRRGIALKSDSSDSQTNFGH